MTMITRETIPWLENAIEIVKQNKSLYEKYVSLGERIWFFETIHLSSWKDIYKHPSLIDGMMFVLENLQKQNPQTRESQIPNIDTIQKTKIWMVEQYVKQLKDKNQKTQLTPAQKEIYPKEMLFYIGVKFL